MRKVEVEIAVFAGRFEASEAMVVEDATGDAEANTGAESAIACPKEGGVFCAGKTTICCEF